MVGSRKLSNDEVEALLGGLESDEEQAHIVAWRAPLFEEHLGEVGRRRRRVRRGRAGHRAGEASSRRV